jgi:predicted membrane chloride channel (bestrophin family)
MTRTFLFIWVFTLPFVLSNDIDNVYDLVFVIFFLTYGFLGIELISIEMDDPYGDDPNDFDVVSLVQVRNIL